MSGTIGCTGNAQIRVELEPEQIHVRSQWLNQTAELALDSLLKLKNATRTHARVRQYNIVNPYPKLVTVYEWCSNFLFQY